MLILAFALLLALMLLGVPVAYAFGLATIAGLLLIEQPVQTIPNVVFSGIDVFPIMAIPFFLLVGVLMRETRISDRLITFVASFTGRIKGSTGLTLIGANAVFGSISGSSVATVSAMGTIMSPRMREEGYAPGYVGALTAVTGTVGILLPPSIPMVVFGIATGTSIGKLFLAGITAGIALIVSVSVVHLLLVRRMKDVVVVERRERLSARGFVLDRFGPAIPALLLPVIVIGGIYSGVFTPTEAGAVACAAVILLGFTIYRPFPASRLAGALREAALTTSSLLIILGVGTAFSRLLTLSGVSGDLAIWVTENANSTLVFLLLANIAITAVALFVEELTTIVILAPLLTPIAVQLGIDPVHFGVIMVVNIGISLSTPPTAPNLFVAARACDTSFSAMTRPVLTLIALAMLPVLILVNAFPGLVLLWQ